MAFWREHVNSTFSVIILIIAFVMIFLVGIKLGEEFYKISEESACSNYSLNLPLFPLLSLC